MSELWVPLLTVTMSNLALSMLHKQSNTLSAELLMVTVSNETHSSLIIF